VSPEPFRSAHDLILGNGIAPGGPFGEQSDQPAMAPGANRRAAPACGWGTRALDAGVLAGTDHSPQTYELIRASRVASQ
jgi:hypothetical protein